MANITSSLKETINETVKDKVMQQSLAQPGEQSLLNSITLETITQNSTKQAAEAKAGISEAIAVASSAGTGARETEISYRHMSESGGRLVNFSFADGSDDDERRAFLQLQGNVTAIKELIEGESASLLEAVYAHLVNGYTSICITGMQENLQERQHILPTVGDTFAATFAGREPQVIVINGFLPFDADKDDRSWFISFINAYKTFIRASVLAKYRCSLRLVFPDFASYTIYPTSISNTLMSDNDTLIPFTLAGIVVDNPTTKAYGYKQSILIPSTTIEEVQNEISLDTITKQIENDTTKDPKEVGSAAKKKNFWETINDGINSAVGELNKVMKSKTMQSINQGFAILKEVDGAVNIVEGKAYGKRATYADTTKKKK